eukprot:m.11497 g.11497  ORF g.11497 m.11497 type:complete len:824 (+) comp2848_c0_seq1:174-2645(+)
MSSAAIVVGVLVLFVVLIVMTLVGYRIAKSHREQKAREAELAAKNAPTFGLPPGGYSPNRDSGMFGNGYIDYNEPPQTIGLKEATAKPTIYGDADDETNRWLGIAARKEKLFNGGGDDESDEEDNRFSARNSAVHFSPAKVPQPTTEYVVADERFRYGFGDHNDRTGLADNGDWQPPPDKTWKDFQQYPYGSTAGATSTAHQDQNQHADDTNTRDGKQSNGGIKRRLSTKLKNIWPQLGGKSEEKADDAAPPRQESKTPPPKHKGVARMAPPAQLAAAIVTQPADAPPDHDVDTGPIVLFDQAMVAIVRLEELSHAVDDAVVDHVDILYEAAYRVRQFLRLATQVPRTHGDVTRVLSELEDFVTDSEAHLDETKDTPGEEHSVAVHDALLAFQWIQIGDKAKETTDQIVSKYADKVTSKLDRMDSEWASEMHTFLTTLLDVVRRYHAPVPVWGTTSPPLARGPGSFPPLPATMTRADKNRVTTERRMFVEKLSQLHGTFGRHLTSGPSHLFTVRGTVGAGAFGQVVLATTPLDTPCAIKVSRKVNVVEAVQAEHAIHERDILAACNSKHIVQMSTSGQDDDCLYVVLEYCARGDLESLLSQVPGGCVSPEQVRFIAGGLTLALEYLHGLNIVYRDLKPANVLIDAEGQLRVADFGFARRLPEHGVTFTMCGSAEYMSPEMIDNRGHGLAVDWWAMGVMIFELLAGYRPFSARSEDDVCFKIVNGEYAFPSVPEFTPTEQVVVRDLLHETPDSRLGATKYGPSEVRSHRFFAGMNWQRMRDRSAPSPLLSLPDRKPMAPSDNDKIQLHMGAGANDGFMHVFDNF